MADTMGEPPPRAYFDTPERAERLQLVAHVIRNTASVPYVRGPEGAGKTRFAERLATIFKQETTLVSLTGGAVADVPQAVCDALGVSTERWPAAAVDAASEDGLLVLVDDVDRLTISALEALQELREVGAKLLFLGESDPVALSIGWELQLIDLPPFSEAQLKDFLAFIGRAEADQPKGGALGKLLRNSQGQPGQVLALLAEGSVAKPAATVAKGLKPGRMVGVAALLVLVLLALWQQERINALFEPPPFEMPQEEREAKPQPGPADAQPEIAEEPPAAAEPEPLLPAEPQPEPVVVEVPSAVEPVETAMPEEMPAPAVPVDEAPLPEMPAVGEAGAESPAAALVEPEVAAADAATEQLEAQPEPHAVVEVVPEPVVVPEPQAEPEPEPEPGTIAWLRSRDPKALTLQLVGARDRAAIDQFIAQHQLIGDYAVYERDLGGKPWFSLVYGDYPDVRAAKDARSRLPKALHNAWPRSFESVMKQLPPE